MIFDKIENLKLYAGSFPGADKVIEFLAECAKKTPEPGKYELDGKKLFVGVQEYSPKTFNSDKLEYHRDYIDIQLLFSGAEDLYYAPLDGLDTVMPYTPEKDCGLSRIPAPEAGRVELDGDKLYASVQYYNPKTPNLEKFEAHRDYVDIQLLLAGSETIY